jgi:CheY-specific phosphatase CheX
LLTYISSTSQGPTGASYARNNWTGYKFNPKSNSDEDDMDVQYVWWKDEAGNASYSTSADWSVERITIQTSAAYVDGNEFIKYQWRIKDKFNSGYDNYNNIIKVNWANYQQSNGTQIQTIKSPSTQSLTGIEGGNAGTFTINLKTANSVKTDYSYTIKNGAGESVATGDFDESGQASVSGLENNVTYTAEANLKEDATYLDQVVTVSDLALVFAEAIGAGSGPSGGSSTFDYYIQDLMGDVVGSDNGVDFQDSYEILAYLQGVDTNNSNLITKDGQTEDYSGIESTYGSYVNNTLGFAKSFTPLDSDVSTKTIDLAHGLRGDVNFSHSWEPTVSSGQKTSSAQSSQARMSMAAGSKFSNPENANIDLISFINDDGLVVFEIQSDVEGMVGSQFNIVYDPNVIELSNVIFDTGNTMTNFSNVIQNGLVRVGSFDQEFTTTVKQGTPYKLIFTPLETIENTSGLISFRVKEGVKADGTQINFIIQ